MNAKPKTELNRSVLFKNGIVWMEAKFLNTKGLLEIIDPNSKTPPTVINKKNNFYKQIWAMIRSEIAYFLIEIWALRC